jgi:hypothetical protein
MQNRGQRTLFVACAVSLCLAVFSMLSCASISPAEVKQETGYYYGFGSGSTASEAVDEAKKDLISNALTESSKRDGSRKGRIEISAEAAKVFKLPVLKPISQEKAAGSVTIVYRIKAAEWDKYEQARETAIRTELMQKLAALKDGSDLPLAERMLKAGELLDRLSREGLAELLTEKGPGSPLVSSTIVSFCREITSGLSINANPEGGFIDNDTVFTAQILTRDGQPVGSLPLRSVWTAGEVEPSISSATTGPDGKAILEYPMGDSFRNRGIRVTITTNFAQSAPHSAGLKNIDDALQAEVRYHHFDDVAKFFSAEVLVPGGSFTAGSLARDKRAAKKEAPRQAQTSDFYIDVYPITNALYEMFLEDTRAETFPDYWDNPEYNQPDQPVIGVSFEDANRFASWLSAQLGVVKRLPTEDEWEKAARGGQDVIYPWGDQSPADGVRANYNGNGRFSATSPVGSFEAGKNAYGLLDMAGNVWQWTSTLRDAGKAAGTGNMIVKGGSWMDGPTDLRASNRRDVDPSKGYVDVGFRLVREASHE